MIEIVVNGARCPVESDTDTPLLWVLRDELGLTGTCFGCGAGLCGCCTVHVDGAAMRSCSIAIGDVANRNITTIEHLSKDGFHPLQQVWIKLDVTQCGYCQSGQLMPAPLCWPKSRSRPMPRSTRRCRETCADAAPTCAFGPPSNWRRSITKRQDEVRT